MSDVFSHLHESNQSSNYDRLFCLQSADSTLPTPFILSTSRIYPGHTVEKRKWDQTKEKLGDKLISSARRTLTEKDECSDDTMALTPDKFAQGRSKSLAQDTIYPCSNQSTVSNLTPAEYLYKPRVNYDMSELWKNMIHWSHS